MTTKIVTEDSAVDGLLDEVRAQLVSGRLRPRHLQALIEHQDPFSGLAVGTHFDPHSYFVSRKGLIVYDAFDGHFLSKQDGALLTRGLHGMKGEIIIRDMIDQVIVGELLEDMHEAKKRAVTLDQIAELISLQPNGEDGELLTNTEANIFFVVEKGELVIVDVYWDKEELSWGVGAWPFGSYGMWNDGSKVFFNTILTL